MIITLLLSLLCVSEPARADQPSLTTVFHDDEGVVYVGVKNSEGESQVISLPFDSGDRTVIPLPAEISHRDVIGLITEKQKLFVLTSGGDSPMLHVYDRPRGSWARVGKSIKCPAFTKVRMQSTRMIFSCEVGKLKHGKSRVSQQTLSFGKERLYRNGIWRFPEFMLRHKGRVALLEGNAPTWDRLRLRDGSNDRTISATDLLQLPMPPASAAKP